MGHVAVGINHHQQRHRCHQGEHHSCKRVDDVPHRKAEVSSTRPNEQMLDGGCSTQLLEQNGIANDRCSSNAADQQQGNGFFKPVDGAIEANQTKPCDQCPNEREHWDQPGKIGSRRHPSEAECFECRQLSSKALQVVSEGTRCFLRR